MEWTAQQPRQAGPLSCLHGTQGQENRALRLELCFSFPSAVPLMIPIAKGAFVTTESSLWCWCLRDQQCRVPLTWAFWNPVILGICFVLVLGKGSELPLKRRQSALVRHGWTKGPFSPSPAPDSSILNNRGRIVGSPTVMWGFWACLPWHHFVQLVLLFIERRLWL